MVASSQVVHVEQVQDTHTKIEGFDLNFQSKALTCLQTLGPKSKALLEWLEKDSISTFSKIGINQENGLFCTNSGLESYAIKLIMTFDMSV